MRTRSLGFPWRHDPLDDKRAEDYLRTMCREIEPGCPRCGRERVYELKDGRRRCSGCGYTFHDFSLRWLNRGGLSARDWLRVADCFARGLTTGQMAAVTGFSYKAGHKALTTIRLALLARDPKAHTLLGEDNELRCYCATPEEEVDTEDRDGHCAVCLSPVFAVTGANGSGDGPVHVAYKEGLPARDALAYPLKRNTWRTFIYTDGFQDMDGLLFSCCKMVRSAPILDNAGPVTLDTLPFWTHARQWLNSYHCVSPGTHPLYLKEVEFRYNHRHEDLRPLVAQALCGLVVCRG